MQRVSDFLATLKDDNGQKIPVIFRPWHENSGSWFWWGEKLCTVEEYKALWNMLQDKLKADGYDNLVWSYSPGCQDNLTAERLLDRYPGDDRVDMTGLDGYQWKPEEKDAFISRTKQNLQVLCEVAKAHNLIPCPDRDRHEEHDATRLVDINPAARREGFPHQLFAHMAQLQGRMVRALYLKARCKIFCRFL